MARGKGTSRGRNAGVSWPWVIVVFVAAFLAATALPFCALFVVGMVPSAVAAVIDRHRDRYLTAAVALLNLAGMVIPTLTLLKLGASLAGALQVLGDPRNWLIIYSTAGVGWMLHAGMPALARVIVDLRAEREERRLERRAEQLTEEWGAGVGRG
ncbi:MAG TPA: hypothetical protein VMU87_11530 [Stellaceae bacterium]|nr:hypothetical protein [Stellaceae bacterium]